MYFFIDFLSTYSTLWKYIEILYLHLVYFLSTHENYFEMVTSLTTRIIRTRTNLVYHSSVINIDLILKYFQECEIFITFKKQFDFLSIATTMELMGIRLINYFNINDQHSRFTGYTD